MNFRQRRCQGRRPVVVEAWPDMTMTKRGPGQGGSRRAWWLGAAYGPAAGRRWHVGGGSGRAAAVCTGMCVGAWKLKSWPGADARVDRVEANLR
jgi:hypothetical protein